ncbi:MAG: hypothetical protein ACJAYU_001465 [Bradymonadia bacterium]|jgi:hypothetical protein
MNPKSITHANLYGKPSRYSYRVAAAHDAQAVGFGNRILGLPLGR